MYDVSRLLATRNSLTLRHRARRSNVSTTTAGVRTVAVSWRRNENGAATPCRQLAPSCSSMASIGRRKHAPLVSSLPASGRLVGVTIVPENSYGSKPSTSDGASACPTSKPRVRNISFLARVEVDLTPVNQRRTSGRRVVDDPSVSTA